MKFLSKIILVFVLLISMQVDSRAASAGDNHLPWFEQATGTELWSVTLEMDINSILKNKESTDFFPAKFSFKDTDGSQVNWDTKVYIRGRFRRKNCEFPPLKLKFPKKKMEAAGFGKHNDVKLVTHCDINRNTKETLLREYLAYQLYAKLTRISYRTRLLRITYKDSQTGAETETYGFLIEDTDALAQRVNAEKCDNCCSLSGTDFDQNNIKIHDLFQYMIGNVDWALYTVRNIKVLTPENENNRKMLVPYDFDFSGLVNARYAFPKPKLDQVRVRDRVYIGTNWTKDEWETTITYFQKKKQELMDTVDAFDLISNAAKKDIKRYLGRFYSKMDNGFIPQNEYGVQY